MAICNLTSPESAVSVGVGTIVGTGVYVGLGVQLGTSLVGVGVGLGTAVVTVGIGVRVGKETGSAPEHEATLNAKGIANKELRSLLIKRINGNQVI